VVKNLLFGFGSEDLAAERFGAALESLQKGETNL
jgi:hypothetical protein